MFELDYKQTADPNFHQGAIDFFFTGEMLYQGEGCPMEHDWMDFMDGTMSTSSQLVVSESAATCIVNQIGRSKLGNILIDNEKLNAFWGTGEQLKMDTTFLSSHVPVFQSKLGAGVALLIHVTYKDAKIQFGKQGSDVIADFTMGMDVSTKKGDKVEAVLYDEFKMRTTANVAAADDTVYIALQSLELDAEGSRGSKVRPIRDNLNMDESEYTEFVDNMGLYMNYLRKYLNAVYFKKGLQFPYNPEEIYTTLKFKEQSMHVFLDVAEEAERFFVDKLWDEDAKKNARK